MTDALTKMAASQARAHFFIEDEGAPDAFASPNWRGAALERNRYGVHRMPRQLWEAIRMAVPEATCLVCGYAPIGQPEPPGVLVKMDWDAFAADEQNPARVSPEWVAYDRSGRVAILAGFDVTIVGFPFAVADEVDQILSAERKNLRELTREDFGHEDQWPFSGTVMK
ncbi:hypothetical protein [Luteibacter sp. Lutesp34]|uniref:hypothetical protein n=1 Tax=Luteibacter sp. Lutesp34 TaxID=3243030 RepID=UPI0039B4EC47